MDVYDATRWHGDLPETEVRLPLRPRPRLIVSHDVNTMKAAAEARIAAAAGMNGLFLVPQSRPTRIVAESLILIWAASQAEEWQDKIVYLPL